MKDTRNEVLCDVIMQGKIIRHFQIIFPPISYFFIFFLHHVRGSIEGGSPSVEIELQAPPMPLGPLHTVPLFRPNRQPCLLYTCSENAVSTWEAIEILALSRTFLL